MRAEIARACRDAGRDPAGVTLVAVSKTFAAEAIEPVIAAGQRLFGENRVQEAKAKWPPLLSRHPGLELHLVGALQSNKVKEAAQLFDAIHSVDRASLAEALGKEIARQKRQPLLVRHESLRQPRQGPRLLQAPWRGVVALIAALCRFMNHERLPYASSAKRQRSSRDFPLR